MPAKYTNGALRARGNRRAIRRKRTTFKPNELATTFISLTEQRRAEGLFLSSGIVPDADTTMEKMLATVERLRLW